MNENDNKNLIFDEKNNAIDNKKNKYIIYILLFLIVFFTALFYYKHYRTQDISRQYEELILDNYCPTPKGEEYLDYYLDSIKNNIINNENFSIARQEIKNEIYSSIVYYLKCEIWKGKNYYDKAKDYVNSLNINDYEKNASIDTFYRAYLMSKEEDNVLFALAKGELDIICPENLSKLCSLYINYGDGGKEEAEEFCDNLCDYTRKSIEDNDFFRRESPAIKTHNTIIMEMALAWRIGGEREVFKLCENRVKSHQIPYCESSAHTIIKFIENEKFYCEELFDPLKIYICDQ